MPHSLTMYPTSIHIFQSPLRDIVLTRAMDNTDAHVIVIHKIINIFPSHYEMNCVMSY